MSNYTQDTNYELHKDKDGNVVTITEDQIYAIWRAFYIWNQVFFKETGRYPEMSNSANWQKSRLLYRLTVEGKLPLVDRPPVVMGGPDYSVEVEDGTGNS